MVSAPRRQRPHFIFATLLVLAGLLLLGLQLEILPQDAWLRLLPFWPVLVVLLGIELLVAGLLPGTAARAVGLVLVVAVAAGTVAFALTVPASAPYTTRTSSAPVAGVQSASLDLALAGGTVEVTSRDLGDSLYQASYELPSGAHVSSTAGSLRIDSGSLPFVGGPSRVELALNSTLPWSVNLSGAGMKGTIDLSGGRAGRVNVSGAGTDFDVLLPYPESATRVELSGVGSTLTLRLSGAPATVTTSGLATTFKVDGKVTGSGWQSPSYTGSGPAYQIEASGLGSTIEILTG